MSSRENNADRRSGHGGHDHEGHDHREHHKQMAQDFKRRFWISLIVTLPILLLAPLIQDFLGWQRSLAFSGDHYVLFALSAIVFAYGGWPFLKGLVDELRSKSPGMMTLIGLAILVAFVYSSAVVFGLPGKTFFWESATLIVVMLLGHWIEMRSVLGASKALEELSKMMPSEAHRLIDDDGQTEEVAVSELQQEDRVLVKPGEKIPVDGVVKKGSSSVNEAMVTGESRPVTKEPGDEVIGGSINGNGSLTVEVARAGEESYLSRVIKMVEEAQSGKSKSERTADRAALWLTVIAVVSGILTLTLWLILSSREFVFALERTVTVMVITCPHALGLAIPLVVAVSTSLAARSGLLIRQRSPFEQARTVDAIVFDKTGTLTEGEFEVSDVIPLAENAEKERILTLAAAVESNSEHTIARAIAEAGPDSQKVEGFEAIPGKGARAQVDGKDIKVVSPGYLQENGIQYDDSRTTASRENGDTVVYVLHEDSVMGAIALRDVIRPESKEAVAALRRRNVDVSLITGDSEEVARHVAEELDIDGYYAEVLPDEKAKKIKEVQSDGKRVAMVGDGVNDAPTLAQADVGVAIGAGTDVAAETADVVLVNSDPRDVVRLLDFSDATHRKTIQNLIWATGYNAVALPLAAGVLFHWGILLNPAVGALLMSLSTVVVAINARIMRVPESESHE